jgi:hypothetical protein
VVGEILPARRLQPRLELLEVMFDVPRCELFARLFLGIRGQIYGVADPRA